MYWERISETIYMFTSERYALVNCVAIQTEEGLVMVDAPPFPDEARQIVRFLSQRVGNRYRALIATHHHIDHVYGLHAFPADVPVIGHERCRATLLDIGEKALEEARRSDPAFDEVTLRIPDVTFGAEGMLFTAGQTTLRFMELPGHTDDNIGIYLEAEQLFIAGDAVMAIPIIARGDWQQAIASIKSIIQMKPETIVQGHGEVILRGEIEEVLTRYINYIECVHKHAEAVLKAKKDRKELAKISLEACGLERVPLGLASHRLHTANLFSVYDQLKAAQDAA